jgi:hypothetical protein
MARHAKVVVLIPPPHEPGEAPMNINRIRTKRVSLAIFPIDRVLNPAVLAVTDWKKPARKRSGMDNGARVLCHSIVIIRKLLRRSKIAVVESTSFE